MRNLTNCLNNLQDMKTELHDSILIVAKTENELEICCISGIFQSKKFLDQNKLILSSEEANYCI